jgi:hypothetical protein
VVVGCQYRIDLWYLEAEVEDLKGSSSSVHWAEFIRRNKNRSRVRLIGYKGSNRTSLNGVLEGARNHPSLTTLTIENTAIQEDGGLKLYQVLTVAVPLKKLIFQNTTFNKACRMLLADGLIRNRSCC